MNDPDREPSVLLVTKGLDLGGSERIVADLAIGLTRRGVPVEVAVVNPHRDRLAPSIEAAGVIVHRLGGSDRVGFAAARRLVGLVRSGRYDVVHVHSPLLAPLVRLAGGSCRSGHHIAQRVAVVPSAHPRRMASHRQARRGDDRRVGRRSGNSAGAVSVTGRWCCRTGSTRLESKRRCRPLRPDRDSGPMAVIVVASHRDAKNYPNMLRAVKAATELGADLTVTCVGEGDGLVEASGAG